MTSGSLWVLLVPSILLAQAKKTAPTLSDAAKSTIAELVAAGIANGNMPGCVIGAGNREGLFYLQAFGNRRLEPTKEPMTTDTVFDLASLTKPMATACSIMTLIEASKLTVGARIVEIFPEFAPHGKDKLTVLHLLTHVSGLIADNPIKDYEDGPTKAWERICALKLTQPIGERFVYSDVNFIVLGKIVETMSSRPLDQYAKQTIFAPLGMSATGYLPALDLRQRAAPTEQREGRWMLGEVHDPRAYLLGGVAGHAGLFSTPNDLAAFAQEMLRRTDPATFDNIWKDMTRPRAVPARTKEGQPLDGRRGLGWDMHTGYSTNKPAGMSGAAFGHGGFTGTALWIDPTKNLYFFWLSNRVHPNGKGLVNPLIGTVGGVVVADLVEQP